MFTRFRVFRHILAVFSVFASVLAFAAGAAKAVVWEENSSGVLTGARAVYVSGVYYDVTFADGSCNLLYDGCKDENIILETRAMAEAAAQALQGQVFTGKYELANGKIAGCSSTGSCYTRLAFRGGVADKVNYVTIFNSGAGTASDKIFAETLAAAANSGNASNVNVALFRVAKDQVSAVPVPSPLLLLMTGAGFLVAFRKFSGSRKAA